MTKPDQLDALLQLLGALIVLPHLGRQSGTGDGCVGGDGDDYGDGDVGYNGDGDGDGDGGYNGNGEGIGR